MTVDENRNPRVQYNGPIEINDELAITFPYAEKEDVACQINEELLRYSVDYTILGQTLTIKTAVGKADTVTIYRTTPLDQQAEFPQNNRFNSAKLNESLDKICMQQQEQSEMINRCTKVPITFMNFDGAIPYPQANKALKINSEATGFTLSDYDPDEAINVTERYKAEAVTARDEAIKQQEEATRQQQEATRQQQEATRQQEEATAQANLAKEWATSETMVQDIDYSSKYYAQESKEQAETVKDKVTEINNAVEEGITNITEQETTSKNNIIAKGTEQIELIQNEGATQIANVQSTGFYMRDDKLYVTNSQGEEVEFKSGAWGEITGDITTQVDLNERFINNDDLSSFNAMIESYVNGSSGYNIWANGYCEQWGNFGSAFSSWTAKTVTFLKTFKDTNYIVWVMAGHTANTESPCINSKTINSFSCTPYNSTGNACWQASGYLAEGEY